MLNKLGKINDQDGKRRGRGMGSGKGGHTVGRGTKGHKARSGWQQPRPGFEGGQMPLSRRIPKLKGFSREYFRKKQRVQIVSLSELNDKFAENEVVSPETLLKKGLISDVKGKIKILANGKLTKKLNLKQVMVSQAAQTVIKAGKETVSKP